MIMCIDAELMGIGNKIYPKQQILWNVFLHCVLTDGLGVRIFVDRKAQLTLLGTEMDYVESKVAQEFVFNNPNVQGTCGCGESFYV